MESQELWSEFTVVRSVCDAVGLSVPLNEVKILQEWEINVVQMDFHLSRTVPCFNTALREEGYQYVTPGFTRQRCKIVVLHDSELGEGGGLRGGVRFGHLLEIREE